MCISFVLLSPSLLFNLVLFCFNLLSYNEFQWLCSHVNMVKFLFEQRIVQCTFGVCVFFCALPFSLVLFHARFDRPTPFNANCLVVALLYSKYELEITKKKKMEKNKNNSTNQINAIKCDLHTWWKAQWISLWQLEWKRVRKRMKWYLL